MSGNIRAEQFNYTLSYDETYSEDYTDGGNVTINVTGGRDISLLKLLAKRMEFNIKYIDPPERAQGNAVGDRKENLTFTGGIGMVQKRVSNTNID